MKQFDLQEYQEYIAKNSEAPKLVTRGGKPVRVICTNKRNEYYPIVALIDMGFGEQCGCFTTIGTYSVGAEHENDLFFADVEPKKKRVPLTYEDLLERVKQGKPMWVSGHPDSYMKHIIGFNKNNIDMLYVINHPSVEKFSYQELTVCSFIDGDPCWKEVEK